MSYNTIKIKKYVDIIEEYAANAAVTPGMLVELMSTGKVRAHATAGGNVLPMFALEDERQGNGIGTAYAADDRVQCWIPQRGEQVYAILENGENVAIGDLLESAGNGNLKKHVPYVESLGGSSAENVVDVKEMTVVAMALEAIDLSGSSGEESSGLGFPTDLGYDKRIRVRIV